MGRETWRAAAYIRAVYYAGLYHCAEGIDAVANPNPITTTAAAIAAQLGETALGARAAIWRMVRTLGLERTQTFVAQALDVEANGGMLIPDGSRTRTLGKTAAKVVGVVPDVLAEKALRRFKRLVETGEIPTFARHPAARKCGRDD